MPKIEKEKRQVEVFTSNYRICGTVYTPPGARLSDFITAAAKMKKFIPVSDAIVSDAEGKEVSRAPFLELNTDIVEFFYPIDGINEV